MHRIVTLRIVGRPETDLRAHRGSGRGVPLQRPPPDRSVEPLTCPWCRARLPAGSPRSTAFPFSSGGSHEDFWGRQLFRPLGAAAPATTRTSQSYETCTRGASHLFLFPLPAAWKRPPREDRPRSLSLRYWQASLQFSIPTSRKRMSRLPPSCTSVPRPADRWFVSGQRPSRGRSWKPLRNYRFRRHLRNEGFSFFHRNGWQPLSNTRFGVFIRLRVEWSWMVPKRCSDSRIVRSTRCNRRIRI